MTESTLILDGIRVVEVAEGIPGPVCGMQLADLGAVVVKVEPPEGDRARYWFEGDAAPVFDHLNRGKRSLCLDLAEDADRAALMRLVDGADVVIVHLDPEAAEAAGIDWHEMQVARPHLVVCELNDLGRQGELAGMAGSELVHQAMSGFMRYAGSRDAPCRVGYEIASVGAGMHAVQAVLAALYRRGEKGGQGDYVSVSLLGQLLSLKAILLAAQSDPDFWAGFHLNGPHWGPDIGWETKDGQVTFDFRHGMRDAWVEFCRTVGLDHLPDDPDYADWRSTIYVGDRKATHGDVYRPCFARMTSDEASMIINDLGGISVKFHDYGEFLAHPQLEHLDGLVEVEGHGRQVGTPFRLEGLRTTNPAPKPAPELGTCRTWEAGQ
jgi:crotonobetainyl-CoA:carnitine CoA-transferase CaiB-like acyl-CoA transferase